MSCKKTESHLVKNYCKTSFFQNFKFQTWKITEFSKFQMWKIAEFSKSQISYLKNCQMSNLKNCQIFKFSNFRLENCWIFKFEKSPNFNFEILPKFRFKNLLNFTFKKSHNQQNQLSDAFRIDYEKTVFLKTLGQSRTLWLVLTFCKSKNT
jgi:hypothetical protein